MTLPQAEQVCRQAKGYRAAAFAFCRTHILPTSIVGNFAKTKIVELTNEWCVYMKDSRGEGWILVAFPSTKLKMLWNYWKEETQKDTGELKLKGKSYDNT